MLVAPREPFAYRGNQPLPFSTWEVEASLGSYGLGSGIGITDPFTWAVICEPFGAAKPGKMIENDVD
jgi:hypothetical protein